MTWRRLARAGVGSALAALLATAAIGAVQAPAAAGGQIAGTVRSAADDAPIARARVVATAADAEPHVALTGADGKYVLPNLPAGSYTITITRTGYATHTYGRGRNGVATTVLAVNQQLSNIDVVLAAGRHIAGRILDEDGTPFAGANVDALVSRFEGGRNALVSVASAPTDDRGEFRLHGLSPGEYFVSAADPAFRRVGSPTGALPYSPTYYPGVAAADQARPVAVAATGETSTIEFRIRLIPPARVSGQLVAYNSRELLSAAIVMSPVDGDGAPSAPPTDPSLLPDGRFSFDQVAPGRYQIRARGQTEAAEAALFAVFSIDVHGSDINGIRLPLRPGAVIDGRLTVATSKGTTPPRLPALRVRAPSIDGSSFGDALTGTVQPDGSFALRGVMKGGHQIVVDGLQPPWVVKEILYRGRPITDRVLDVDEQEQVRGIRITINDLCSEVAGVVQDKRNRPVSNAGVLVFSGIPLHWMPTSRRMRVVYTDDRGRFSITGLPAGEYVAVAAMEIDEGDLGRHDRLRALLPLGTVVRLATDDALATVTLRLVPAIIRDGAGR